MPDQGTEVWPDPCAQRKTRAVAVQAQAPGEVRTAGAIATGHDPDGTTCAWDWDWDWDWSGRGCLGRSRSSRLEGVSEPATLT